METWVNLLTIDLSRHESVFRSLDDKLLRIIADFITPDPVSEDVKRERLSYCPQHFPDFVAIDPPFGYWCVHLTFTRDDPVTKRVVKREWRWFLDQIYRECRYDDESLHIDEELESLIEAGDLQDQAPEIRQRVLDWLERDGALYERDRMLAEMPKRVKLE